MNCFRYKLEHDYGFAPNPFHGVLSLATCKGDIRNNKHLEIGDWIIGLGSVAMNNLNHLIFAMKLEEKITFDEYWNDERFQCKKPILNGSLVQTMEIMYIIQMSKQVKLYKRVVRIAIRMVLQI